MLTHCGTQTIDTGRLTLRAFRHSDADDMLAYWISDPKVQSLYCEPVYSTKEEVGELLQKFIDSYAGPDYYRWAIIENASNKCIGQIAYFMVNTPNHFAEMEYCIGRQFQRKGYMTEAARAVVDYGFININLHKVQICHRTGNDASRGVILKCHCTYEGTLRDSIYEDGRYIDRLYYSLLRSEWERYRDETGKGR